MAQDTDILADAKKDFQLCEDAEAENRVEALDDLRFSRLDEQWPVKIKQIRERQSRPCLTINRMPSFIRQVVNDARQNKPSIKVKPVDSNADVQTAEIINGLIRNIEYSSNADVAYDTAADFAVTMGFGYIRVNIDYTHDDSFDQEILIERVANPFSIYGDPFSTAADSSDWNLAFAVDLYTKDQFNKRWKGADPVNWTDSGGVYAGLQPPWLDGDNVLVAEWWKREEVTKTLLRLNNGEVMYEDAYERGKDLFDALGFTVVADRPTRGYKVTQRILSGAEILDTNEWAGRYIPLIPVYGEEVNIEGKRCFRSLIRSAKDAQRMFNYWRSMATELVALAPRAPFIGKRGAFDTDLAKWESANTENHPFIEYDGDVPPERQPFTGVPAGALQEAMSAADDMKSIMGLYDASLGAQSNEISGVAIGRRQTEGDTSTFHFIDNLSRGIKHTGRVILDLIPSVYSTARVIRILGPDGQPQNVRIGPAPPAPPPQQALVPLPPPGMAPVPGAALPPQMMPPAMPPAPMPGQAPPMMAPPAPIPPPGELGQERIYDLTAGKYDLAVEVGPAFTTQRETFVAAVTEIIRSFPQAAGILGPVLVKHMDFPNADEIAQRLEAAAAQAAQGKGPDPQTIKLQQAIAVLQAQLAGMKADKSNEVVENEIDKFKAGTDRMAAENDRIRALTEATTPVHHPAPHPGPFIR